MYINKRDLLKKAMDNQEVSRVPIGFWHHFILGEEQFLGLKKPEVLEKAIKGHIDYYEKTNPDMMKLMNEGFFGYPPIMENALQTKEDLMKIKSIGPNHDWIKKQVEHVKKLTDIFKKEVMTFYNVFAPLQAIRIKLEFLDMDFERFVYLAENFPNELYNAGLEIQKDFIHLIEMLFKNTSLDGIYYCVQNIQTQNYDNSMYEKYIMPTELPLLNRANELSDYNILHICGYARHTNNLKQYINYNAKVYNWAVHTEGVSLKEGKELFGNKCVLGGFDNNTGTLIESGTKEEINQFVKKLIDENGYKGYIIGADCSIPNHIDDIQVKFISDSSYINEKKENKA